MIFTNILPNGLSTLFLAWLEECATENPNVVRMIVSFVIFKENVL